MDYENRGMWTLRPGSMPRTIAGRTYRPGEAIDPEDPNFAALRPHVCARTVRVEKPPEKVVEDAQHAQEDLLDQERRTLLEPTEEDEG